MFTLDQITAIHDRHGTRDNLAGYLRALRNIGVAAHDSYITDGHSEYTGTDGQRLTGPPFHEPFIVAATCDNERFLAYLKQIDEGGAEYVKMSRTLADLGVEKWTFDTVDLTITYRDRAGNILLTEDIE